MAKGSNGKGALRPFEKTVFTIGGTEYFVPPLNLYILEECEDDIKAFGPNLNWIEYASRALKVVVAALNGEMPELTHESLSRKCSVPEMRALIGKMGELFEKSGFIMGEAEAAAESPGTGISPPSPPTSQPTASAPGTLTG